MSDIKQKAREMFDKVGGEKILNNYDKKLPKGHLTRGYDYPESPRELDPEEVKSFIDQIIDLAIAERDKEIVEMIEKTQGSYVEDPFGNNKQGFFKEEIINLITNTNK